MCFAGFNVCFWLLQAVRLAVMGGFRADAQRLSRLFPDLVHEGVYTEGPQRRGPERFLLQTCVRSRHSGVDDWSDDCFRR